MKHVLALQHTWEDPPGFIGEIIRTYDLALTVIDVEKDPLPHLTGFDACVALGGSQHVYDYDRYPYAQAEKELLREIIRQDLPYLGICLGAQLLAEVLGGKVKRHTLAEIGFFDVQFTAEGAGDPLHRGLPGHQKVFHWHEDTFDLPPGAILLATSEQTENQAFRYGRAYGLQYHIELDQTLLDLWLHQPDSQKDIVNRIGMEGYQRILYERPLFYELYRAHTYLLVENFLRINRLI